MSNDNRRKLYDALSQDYDMGTYEQFCKDIQDETKRKKLYDATSEVYDYGDYAKFSSQLGFGQISPVGVSTPTPDQTAEVQPSTENKQEGWKPTPMQKAFMMGSVQSSLNSFKAHTDASMERLKNTSEYYNRGGAFSGNKPVKGDMRYNEDAGKIEQTYLTPTGTATADKFAAERETRAYNDYVDNMTVSGQLRRAGRDLSDLHRKREERVKAIHDKWAEDQKNNKAPLAAVLGAQTYVPSIQSDPEYRALTAAIHQAEKRVQTIQHENDRQDGKDVGFWRGFGEVVGDIKTWDFGYSGLMDAMTMLDATSKPSPNRPAKTDAQKEAEQIMLEQTYEAQQAQSAYGQNDSFWNRAGVMTGEMLPFMLDFAIMGGAKGGTSMVTRNLDAVLLRSLHKAAPKIARNKAVQWTTKALGAMPEDLLYRAPLMTNTVQGMKTASDIIDRKLGDVVIRDDGTYDFSNDKTWGSAVWQGEANAIIENYSEMFGTHLEGVLSLKTVGKLADTFGAKRLSGILTKASNSELAGIAGTMQKHLNQLGVSDYFGEVGEEYYGQLWRTMLNLDDAYKQNPDGSRTNLFLDGQFHGDIWGGMALSMGLMGAGKYSISAAAYGSMKHRVNKTDTRASEIFTPEIWNGWRERIDGTTNDKIGEMAEAIVADPTLTDEQRTAAMNYMEASLNLRGFNLASVARQRGGEMSEDEAAANESYMDGYTASTPQEMNDAKKMLDLQHGRLASALSEDLVQDFDNDPIGALSVTHAPELRRIASDYVNAKAVYDGMIQRVRDDVDGRIAQSNAMIDSRINRETGMIQPATMKADDRRVYIVNGTVAMFEDGTGVDTNNSSESIIIRDADTGKVEFADPTQFHSVDEAVDAETEKEAARAQIIDEIAVAAANNIDGVLSFTPGESYSVLDIDGNPEDIAILGQPTDENGIPLDGYVDIQYPDGTIQSVATSDLQQWVDAANTRRVEQFDAERQAERAKYESNSISLQENQSEYGNGSEQNNDERADARQDDGGSVVADTTGIVEGDRDRSDIRVYEEGLATSRDEYSEYSERTRRNSEAERLIGIARQRGQYVDRQKYDGLGERHSKRTGESEVYINKAEGKVYKIKNPAAKSPMKGGVQPEDAIYEHLVHNKYFPETRYQFEGISDDIGDLRIVLSQGYIDAVDNATNEQIEAALAEKGLYPEGNYRYGDNEVSVTDVTGDNALLGADGKVYFIDPIIDFKKPIREIIGDGETDDGVPERTPPQSALSRVPLNEKGKPDFGAVDADTAWDAIVEKTSNEAMAQSFAENMVAASEVELKKAEKVKTKPTTDIDEFIAADSERIANIDRAKTALDHWKKVAGTKQRRQAEADAVRSAEMRKRAEEARIKAEQEREEREEAERWEAEKRGLDKRLRDTAESVRHVPEAVEVLKDMNPQSIDEVASWLLSRHKVIWSDTKRGGVRIKYGVASHTGFGEGERRKLFGLFASAEKGGISLDRLSEDLFKEACDVFGVAYDNKSARDALIERIGEARTMGDIRNYIANNRIARATRVAAEFDAYEAEQREEHYQEAYHMGYDEYEAYEEQLLVEMENAFRNFDEQEFYGNIADELVNQQRYGLRSNEEAVGEREVAADGGGVEVLSGTESGEAGGAPGDVVGQEVSGGAGYALRDTSGGLLEGASRGLDGPGGGVVDAGVRISADDLAKLGERDRREVEDYLSRRWSCDVGVIGDVRDIESLPEDSRADIVDAYEDGETWAIYSRDDKKIYIFAGKNGDESLSGVLLHENVHAVVDMLGDDCREFLESYAGQISALPYTNGVFGGMYADIQDLYAEDKAEEEFLAYSLQYVELYNKVLTKIKKSLDEPTLRYLEDKILSKLYEPAGRTDKGEAVHDNSRVQWSRVQEDNGSREREPHEISGGASGGIRESGWESEAGGQPVGERYESTEEYPGRVAEGKAVQDNSRAQHARVQETVVDTEGGFQGGERRELGEGGERRERGDEGIAEEAEIASEEDALNSRIEVKDDDWTEGGGYTPTLKRTVVIDGTHNVTQVDAPNDKGDYTGSIFEYDGKTFGDLREVISYIDSSRPATIGEQVAEAEAEVNTTPTDGQKKAGNYKKGHVQVGTFDVTIENPKGSKRSGTDPDGKKWETTMTHTYGYILGTKGVDGDHIDVYISSDIDGWNGRKVFVVDQYNPDGSFDEHKVMLGFNDRDEAFEAYLSNYEAGWEKGRRLDVTAVNLDDFEKWIESSKRKTKAFTEYAGVKVICPVCGKAGIPNYHNHDVVCPQCNSDLSVFRQIDQLSENEKQELSDKFIGEDNQGNPIDHAGKLIVEDVTSIDDITDEDFVNPTRTIGLPKLPNAVSDAIGSKNKRVIIKKNIFGKNHKNHKELTPSESREILRTALYTPSLYGRNQKQTRPYNWILIHLADKSTCVLLEVDNSKENCEIVNWHYLSGETLARKKRQAIKEGGRILTLSENNVAADTHDGLPSDDKGNTLSTDKQTESAESSDGYTIEPRKDTRDNSDIFAVKFEERVSREVFKGQNAIAKKHGGYWSNFGKKGFLFKTREDAEAFANEVIGKDKTQLSEEAPLSIDDMQSAIKSAFEETPTDKEEISSSSEETTAEKKDVNPSGNKLVTDEQYAKLLAKMRKKMGGQLNMGVDPEILAIGSMMAVYHIEKGARKFAEYVKAMVADLGEKFPARYLKGFYKAAHEMIEDAAPEIAVEMDSDDVVNTADVASIISGRIDAMATAEMVDVTQSSIDRNQTELKQIEQRKDKEFEYYDELAEAKERLEEYTEKMKAELAEKEAKYADMDADVEVATDITLSEEDSEETEDEELLRDGYGAYSDAEVSMENDPWSKAWGESIRTKRQQRQFAERERNRMRERVEALSSVLGVDIEVVEDASFFKGKEQRAKGWYDTETGKITVVVGNHNSAADMEATILHEAVAHHGLRQLLGEHFDEFLDKVYEAAENGIKEQIALLASRNGWKRRVATEEYLAGLAEETDFDRAEERVGGWFDKIKRFFIDMLFKAGFKHIKPGSIGDNELRYILWRSYQNLANPGRYRAFEWEAEDVAMQYKLQIGQYDTTSEKEESAADSGIRFRDGDFTPRDRKLAADVYEKMLSRGSWQFREATQDSMLGLKTLYESILGSNTRIENVAGYENAYLYENRMSSANNGEQHQYFCRYMKPLLESIHKLCGSKDLDRRILTDYMMAKHGLERNEYMRNEAAANGEDTERDFAGLCGLTGEDDWQVAETVAQQMVDDYESDHDTAELWNNVKKATNATLEKIYLSGLISEDTYNKVLGMYDFYIPLRGWDETTSDEVYGYLTSKDGPLMGNVFKTAEGRESKADDPIATIAMMADDAIRQGNRNVMKQRFLNFVHGNPSDLVSVNEMWLQHNDVTDEWEPVFADLQPDMTHAEVESEIAKFEVKMEALRTAEPDKYKKGGDARNIPYKVVRGNLNEHQVLVKRNGRTYVMTINGNPRAAQALNGLTNTNVEMGGFIGNMLKLGEYVNRHLSAFYTTRNPDFVVSNFLRDMLYSNCMTWVKENPRYALRFHKNFGKVNPLTLRKLLSKWENDNLSDSNYLEKMFKEFMLNGGETGYTSVKDIEGHKRTIASELKKQGSTGRKAWSALGMQLDLLNRSAENCARFAAFLTSREMGRTLDRSIHDAKEVSVNFNKKGSGGKFVDATGQKLLGKVGSYLGGGGRIAFVFWNAGIQGMTNFGRAGKRNPGKAIGGAAALFTLGYVIPLLAQMLGGGDGDDDDKNAYYNLPEYVRRSNICFKAGEQWITIPLPIEYRAIYGMGELACGVISGNERYSNSELAYYIAAQVSQVMPLDFLEGANPTSHDGFSAESLIHPFIPSAFKPFTEAYIMNKGWTGLPVYKDTPYNKNDPEWTKAYQSADQHLVSFTRWLNETSGGDDYKKGAIDINPAKLEYLLSGTFGGVVSTTGKLKKMGETALGEREFEWRNMLLANRVIKSGDERTANRKLQNEYFKYLTEYEETNRLRKKYENAADDGILGYAERVDFLYNSAEYLRFGIFEKYKPDIDAIREEIKEETNPEAKKELQEELFSTMRELVDELHDVGK